MSSRLRIGFTVLTAALSAGVGACSSGTSDANNASGGAMTTSAGGTSSGGSTSTIGSGGVVTAGGTSNGGTVSSQGGIGQGGAAGGVGPSGGNATGGIAAGGMGNGGTSAGGAGQGGNSTGGTEMGGAGGAGAGGAMGAGGAPPGLPAGYTLIFEESFATPAAVDNFLFANPSDWSYVATDGGYAQWTGDSYAPPQYSPHSIMIIKGMKFSSFVLTVDIMQTSMTGAHRDACIFWNMVSPSQFYYAHIGQAHDAAASQNIHIVNNAGRLAITTTFTDGFDWGNNEWKTIRVVRDAVAGTMEVYGGTDAMPMLTATDTTFTDGYLGIGSFDDQGRVRNLRVWSNGSTQEPATFFMPLQ
ncbi:MAG TPA: hypothetical protein VL137_04930 [Polyangiaceae bacterium]|jgi:hypothetical protein|nr:hypothetical protein [Polyangiaceae bacterium]